MIIHIRLPAVLVTMVFAGLLLITLSASAFAANHFRLQFGAGVQGGDPEVAFADVSGDLDTDTGFAISGGAWVDKVGWKHLSLGLEYLGLQDSDFSESGSFSGTVLGVTISGTGDIDVEPTIDAVMFNAAIRKNDGSIHPYFGGGIGVGFASADVTASGTGTFNGEPVSVAGSIDDDDTAFAGQLFAGVDADVDANWYVGINGRYFLMDADLFGADVELNMAASIAPGREPVPTLAGGPR